MPQPWSALCLPRRDSTWQRLRGGSSSPAKPKPDVDGLVAKLGSRPERSQVLLSEESGQSGEIGQIEACIRHIRDEVAGIRRAIGEVRDIQVVEG
jgi:hypothetical protein